MIFIKNNLKNYGKENGMNEEELKKKLTPEQYKGCARKGN
jgi:hypothetical protein